MISQAAPAPEPFPWKAIAAWLGIMAGIAAGAYFVVTDRKTKAELQTAAMYLGLASGIAGGFGYLTGG